MSTKTLRKRIALVAVSALTAGDLSVASTPVANAAAADLQAIDAVGQISINAAANAGTKLGKAFKTAKGKVLYGGGGITPDATVEIDPVLFDTNLNALYHKNIIGNFAYRYFLTNSGKIKTFADAAAFASGFNVDDNVINQLMDFAQKQDVSVKLNDPSSINWTKQRIKAMVARIAWDETGYFQVLNKSDNGFAKAVEAIGK